MSTADIEYEKRGLKVKGKTVQTVLKGIQGSANLVAIQNMIAMKHGVSFGKPGTRTEHSLKTVIRDVLYTRIGRVGNIPRAQEEAAINAVVNIRTEFLLQPRLGAYVDFVPNGSTLLCHLMDLPLVHGWVLDAENSSYDFLKDFSHAELGDHLMGGNSDHLEACQKLMDDHSSSQLTSYGFQSLAREIREDEAALFLWRNRLDVIHKHNGALFLYVADQAIVEEVPQAVWMLFEEHQEENIYLTDRFTPVKDQPHAEKARKWYLEFLRSLAKVKEPEEDKGKETNKSSPSAPGEPSEGKEEEGSEPSEASRKEEEDKSGKERREATCSQAVDSHNTDGGDTDRVPQQDGASSAPPQAIVDGAGSVSSSESTATKGISTTGNEAKDKSEDNSVPKGDGADFLEFLNKFKDNGCSTYYFEGNVAAFALQKPWFYVPYEFIMAFNEPFVV